MEQENCHSTSAIVSCTLIQLGSGQFFSHKIHADLSSCVDKYFSLIYMKPSNKTVSKKKLFVMYLMF